jgi:type VI secretion system protein ImpJ
MTIQKVLWSEGLFLTPHHFQQWDRYHEDVLNFRMRALTAFSWGAEELQFNDAAIENGIFEVIRCRAILPDGLPIDAPNADALPPTRSFTEFFPPAAERMDVHLAVPLARPGMSSVAMNGGNGGAAEYSSRYRPVQSVFTDENTGENERPVTLAAKNVRLLFGDEPLDNQSCLKIAEVRRTFEGKMVLDDNYIPPAIHISAAKSMIDIVRRLLEILAAKSASLAELRRQKGAGVADFTTSDVANFWLLHTVNASIPAMMHFHHVQRVHPEQLYLAMARLAGELMTFVTEGHPSELPKYIHTDLTRTFSELDRRLRLLLETVIPTRCVPIPLERTKESIYIGRIVEEGLLASAEFFLGVYTKLPEAQIIERVPRKSKIASVDTINYLLGQALPGVVLRPVQVPPGPLPVRTGFKYFRLEKIGTYWDTISSSRTICIYFPAEFPELRLELYAIKD